MMISDKLMISFLFAAILAIILEINNSNNNGSGSNRPRFS